MFFCMLGPGLDVCFLGISPSAQTKLAQAAVQCMFVCEAERQSILKIYITGIKHNLAGFN